MSKTKAQLVTELVVAMAPGDRDGQAQLARHHNRRTRDQIEESLARWRSIQSVTQDEIDRHCIYPPPPIGSLK